MLSRKEWIAVVVALAVLFVFFGFMGPFQSLFVATSGEERVAGDFTVNQNSPFPDNTELTTTASGLQYLDVAAGSGAEAAAGKAVSVHYTGALTDGQVFDTSRNRGPFTFNLGAGEVIKGWDEGVAGMKVGGKRILVIPAALGYGEAGFGPIPGGATLVFEVELLEVN